MKGLLPVAAVRVTLAGAPKLADTVTFMQGIWIEAVLTFFLVSAVFGTAVSPEAPKIGGVGLRPPVFLGRPGGGGPPRPPPKPPPPLRRPPARREPPPHAVGWVR